MRIEKRFLAVGTPFQTEYYIAAGQQQGTTLVITAGIHGNEVGSIKAAKKLLDLVRKDIIRINKGQLIIVPIVNVEAYKKRIRGVPDLNRTFPRYAKDISRHPLSAALIRLEKKLRPSWVIDLHEANGFSKINKDLLGQSLITDTKSLSKPAVRRTIISMNRMIKNTTKHFTIRLRDLPGSSRTAAKHLFNARSITVETSWDLPLAERIKFQLGIVRKLLKEAGLINKSKGRQQVAETVQRNIDF